MVYHPQADGQTEVFNQSLEISLQAYVGPSRDDWAFIWMHSLYSIIQHHIPPLDMHLHIYYECILQ